MSRKTKTESNFSVSSSSSASYCTQAPRDCQLNLEVVGETRTWLAEAYTGIRDTVALHNGYRDYRRAQPLPGERMRACNTREYIKSSRQPKTHLLVSRLGSGSQREPSGIGRYRLSPIQHKHLLSQWNFIVMHVLFLKT